MKNLIEAVLPGFSHPLEVSRSFAEPCISGMGELSRRPAATNTVRQHRMFCMVLRAAGSLGCQTNTQLWSDSDSTIGLLAQPSQPARFRKGGSSACPKTYLLPPPRRNRNTLLS